MIKQMQIKIIRKIAYSSFIKVGLQLMREKVDNYQIKYCKYEIKTILISL